MLKCGEVDSWSDMSHNHMRFMSKSHFKKRLGTGYFEYFYFFLSIFLAVMPLMIAQAGTRTQGRCSEDRVSVHGTRALLTELNGSILSIVSDIISIHSTHLTSEMPWPLIHFEREADCILSMISDWMRQWNMSELHRILFDTLPAKYCMQPFLSLFSITVLSMTEFTTAQT